VTCEDVNIDGDIEDRGFPKFAIKVFLPRANRPAVGRRSLFGPCCDEHGISTKERDSGSIEVLKEVCIRCNENIFLHKGLLHDMAGPLQFWEGSE
jgi:hypothetical protein